MITEAEAELRAAVAEQSGCDEAAETIRELHKALRRAVRAMPRGVRELYEAGEDARAARRAEPAKCDRCGDPVDDVDICEWDDCPHRAAFNRVVKR